MVNEIYPEEGNVIDEAQKLVNIAQALRDYAIKLWLSKRKITDDEAKIVIEKLERMREKENDIFAQIRE